MFLIVKRGMYYRPEACGYTMFKRDAGRYTKKQVDLHMHEGVSAIEEELAKEYAPAADRVDILEDKVRIYEEALAKIALDESGFLAGNPSRWPCYTAISALYYNGLSITQEEYNAGNERLKQERTK